MTREMLSVGHRATRDLRSKTTKTRTARMMQIRLTYSTDRTSAAAAFNHHESWASAGIAGVALSVTPRRHKGLLPAQIDGQID